MDSNNGVSPSPTSQDVRLLTTDEKQGVKNRRELEKKELSKKTEQAAVKIVKINEISNESTETLQNHVVDLTPAVQKAVEDRTQTVVKGTNDCQEQTEIIKEEKTSGDKNQSNSESKSEKQLKKEAHHLYKSVSNLEINVQDAFNEELRKELQNVGGFQTTFSNDNERYKNKVQEDYRTLRETEQAKYRQFVSNYAIVKDVFDDRIGILESTIRKHRLEMNLLDEAILGNESYWNAWYKYGATYRLWEMVDSKKGALEARRVAIKLQLGEVATPEAAEIQVASISEIRGQIITLSRDIDVLKEEATVYNEAMKKQKEEMIKSGLPKLCYLHHKQKLDGLKLTIDKLRTNQVKRIQELDDVIKQEHLNQDPQYLSAQQEQAEITKRWEMINLRHKEITTLLANMASSFKLPEEVINSKETVALENLSSECTLAFDLLKRITSHKEDVVLGNTWEMYALEPQRRIIYFQAQSQATKLVQEKKEFEKSIDTRKKVLATAVETYCGFIKTMQHDLRAIEAKYKILETQNEEREKWQVNATKV
jgi:hypothetical protein